MLQLEAVATDVQQDAHRGHRDEQRRAAVTDEGQRYADNWEGSADHEEVAEGLADDEQHDADRQDLTVDVARPRRDVVAADCQHEEQGDDEQDAEVAVLLREDREGEVGVGLRQVLILADALAEAHAPETARADRRHRLHGLVADALRVAPGVIRRLHAQQAVRLPDDKADEARNARKKEHLHLFPGNADEKGHEERHAEDDAGRAHVRLKLDECRHEEDDPVRRRLEQVDLLLALHHHRQESRGDQDARQLGKLRRLHAEPGKGKPSSRTVDDRAHDQHEDQGEDRNDQEPLRDALPAVVVDAAAGEADEDAQDEPDGMADEKVIRIVVTRRREDEARAEYIDGSQQEQDSHDDDDWF